MGWDAALQEEAAHLVHLSVLSEGRPSLLDDCRAFVRRVVDDPHALCIVAFYRAIPVGVVVAFGDGSAAEPCFEVRHLFVAVERRGGQIAHALMRQLLGWTDRDDANVVITTVGEPRPYYRALGFEPTHQVCVASLKRLRERLGG